MATRREAVIVATARTGLAKSFRGSFNLTRPDDMAAHCIKSVMEKTPKLDAAEIDDVVMGTGFPEGPQGFNVGRNVATMAGLPVTVAGQTVSRFCSSGLQAVATAAHMVENEGAEAVIGGGLESITMMQNDFNKNNLFNPWFKDHHRAIYMPMGQTAEIVAERYKVSREKQDELALASQKRTAAAQQSGKFKDEISPMTVEMEPPFGLSFAGSMPSLSRMYTTCEANASFSSTMSMSCILRPCCFSSFGMANTGPMPISSASQPAKTQPRKKPIGFTPSAFARSADMMSVAEAPSENCEELPAVTLPVALNAGGSLARPSSVVSGRLHSSLSTTTSFCDLVPVALSVTSMVTFMGEISSLNLPDCCAAAVRFCEASASSSCFSRLTL